MPSLTHTSRNEYQLQQCDYLRELGGNEFVIIIHWTRIISKTCRTNYKENKRYTGLKFTKLQVKQKQKQSAIHEKSYNNWNFLQPYNLLNWYTILHKISTPDLCGKMAAQYKLELTNIIITTDFHNDVNKRKSNSQKVNIYSD